MQRADSTDLTALEREIVEEELRLADAVRGAIDVVDTPDREERVRGRMGSLGAEMSEALADDLSAIAAEAHRVDFGGVIAESNVGPPAEQFVETRRSAGPVLESSFCPSAEGGQPCAGAICVQGGELEGDDHI